MILPLSASHAHSLANLRKTPDDVVAELGRIRAARDAAGSRTIIEGGVGTAFGSTLQGSMVRGSAPYVMLMILSLALVMLWPQIALWLPDTMLNIR